MTAGFFFVKGQPMAGDWIKVENVTPDKPEVFSIAETLGLDADAVLGKLVRLWIWADQQTYDGNAGTVTRALLDRVASVTGFAQALEEAGWLRQESHGYIFPNFDRHNGQSAKQRALTARRVAKYKAKKGNDVIVTSTLPREEKRRVKEEEQPAIKTGYYFAIQNGGMWDLPQRKLDEYLATYSDRLDVAAELRKAAQWLRDNKDRRKTKQGMPSFLTRWLNRASDGTVNRTPTASGNHSQMDALCDRLIQPPT